MSSDSTSPRRLGLPVAELVGTAPVALLWASLLASGGLGFAAEVLFARQLSLSEYGSLATALAAVLLASPIAGAGVGHFLLSRAGDEGALARRWLGPALRTSLVAASLAAGPIMIWGFTTALGALERQLLLILLPTLLFFSLAETAHGIFQLERRHLSLALLGVGPYVGRFAVAVGAVVAGLTVLGIGLALLGVGFVLTLAIGAAIYRRHRHGFQLAHTDDSRWSDSFIRDSRRQEGGATPTVCTRAVAAGTWPYAVAGVLALLHSRADVILFGWLLGPEEAGLLQVSLAVMSVVFYLPAAVYGKYLLPLYHAWASRDRKTLASTHKLWTRRMGVTGVLAGVLVAAGTPWLVPSLFGPEFEAAMPLLVLLSLWVPLRFASAGWETLLGTREWIRLRVRVQLLGGTTHLLTTVALIPSLGLYAAVVSTIGSELLLLLLYRRASFKALQ